MKRFGVKAMAAAAGILAWAGPAAHAAPKPPEYTAGKGVKINVMGEWAHPDDDTSIIGPCGVWHQRYDTRCGIIMVTRGEGGGNSAGPEIGPPLGLRRENEDRVAHYRSGTVDIFNLDKIDFFYNQSAPLTGDIWDREDTLRRVVRIIRMTQPDVYIGFTPTLAAGHGNHQYAGRLIWEGLQAAADSSRFPGQLTGPDALSTWQVKKAFSGGQTAGSGGTTGSADCTTGFIPTGLDNVAGVWTGYDSPYSWPAGNVQGQPAGSKKSWAQVATEGARAYPTQSRVQYQEIAEPGCSRFGQTANFVPFQPNTTFGTTTANPLAGRDDAALFGAAKRDPGGLPLNTTERIEFSRFYNVPGQSFDATVTLGNRTQTIAAANVALQLPAGWTADATTKPIAVINPANPTRSVTFTITPPAGATVNQFYKIAAQYSNGATTGYTDGVIRVVSPAEGRFERFGNWEEYDNWVQNTAPLARRLGRSAAIDSMPVDSAKTISVDVHNWSDVAQSGNVTLTLPPGVTADATSKPYGPLPGGGDTQVDFTVTNTFTNATLPPGQNVTIGIATSYDAPTAGTGSENLTLSILPKTTIPVSATAPTMDGTRDAAYSGPTLDISRLWQGTDCATKICGGDARVVRSGDDLYFHMNIQDNYQSYAVTPVECVGHWQADSVEILIDPRGNASRVRRDTANTFKLGVFPYTNDPGNTNGNGANGPCWSRDADNHQGYSTGPLRNNVHNAPNAPGVEVASTATWVGSNETTVNHAYSGGGYALEVKIPIADLPADLNPNDFGLNITPYDNDDTSAAGTTTLRHIDSSTRIGWSAFGSVQSDPYRWGRASIAGGGPAGSDTVDELDLSSPNLDGTHSPQTIAQSARDGVPISGRDPAPASNRISIANTKLGADALTMDVTSTGAGTLSAYLWSGLEGQIPVYKTSCAFDEANPLDYGLSACAVTDGGIPPWSPDQSGRVQASKVDLAVAAGTTTVTIPVTAAQRARLRADGSALVSYDNADDQVQAFDLPLAVAKMSLKAVHTGGEDDSDAPRQTELRVHLTGTQPFPGDPTGTVQFAIGGTNVGDPVKVDANGDAVLRVADSAFEGKEITATYSGDGDYASSRATTTEAGPGSGPAGPAGPAGPTGPAGPQGPRGRTPRSVSAACKVKKGSRHRKVVCAAALSANARMTLQARVGRKSATGSGRRTVKVTIRAAKRVTKRTKVRLTLKAAGRSVDLTVRANNKARTAVAAL